MGLVLTVLSPDRKLVERLPVEEVTLSSSEGEIQVLAGHAPMVGLLETGTLKYVGADGKPAVAIVSTGTFEVSNDILTVTAETLELAHEIDLGRAKKAQQVSEENLKSPELNEASFKKYQLKLQRALIRQQFAGRL